MATILDYGAPTDPLSTPSLSEWAAAVATRLEGDTQWVSWSPTVSGATYSAVAAAYCKRGTLVTVVVKATVATVTGDVQFGLPFAAHADQIGAGIGTARCLVAGSNYLVHVFIGGTSTLYVRTTGTNGLGVSFSATVPATWAAGNTIQYTATYRSAA